MTKHQPSVDPTAAQDAQWEQRASERVQWGSRLTPEQHEWQVNVLLPAIIACLRDAADAANAEAGQTSR
ncbi:MAG: hypothetical protein M3Q71_10765 [Chloroflexota bacterium]|nr:hypothetical protein [Chloroflexota bacterium]